MKKITKDLLIAAPIAVGGALYSASRLLYSYAFNRSDIVPEPGKDIIGYANDYYYYIDWLNEQKHAEHWRLVSKDKKEELNAVWVPAKHHSKFSVLISHGYKGNGVTMANLAQMYHFMGFNVLLPDSRGHGDTSDPYISFGWLDHYDALAWLNMMIKRVGPESKVFVHGVSMGGATALMLAGEDLPPQVKGIIDDCGYSSLNEELVYLARKVTKLPVEPVRRLMSKINKVRTGFSFDAVSSVKQLKKAKVPIFVIHGADDDYVPTYMAYQNYNAITTPKKIWIVPNAGHAMAFWVDPREYHKQVTSFIKSTL
ncbi:alpha/beta hydrolase [Xylocopilactobacillus apicola]|uniref:Alpha/beta hydrolase n=1 Tax=Xylocopilactobacillus apicola TaxID=2932184 RepID=A0AAU9D0D6_9LACO|nr:alpha/beta hydrolase [Xylocopilactobacillus apicola]BDR59729.1 alpha/beta hydrolase [Xylocopilactobacillus apicola]